MYSCGMEKKLDISNTEILKKRIRGLNTNKSSNGKCVLYIMSRDMRVGANHALLAAQKHAIAKKLPLAVVFVLLQKSGFRAKEHYEFMLEGLKEVENALAAINIPFIMLIGKPYEVLTNAFYHYEPDAIYFDFNPLRGSRKLQEKVASSVNFPVYTVDTHNIVPVWVASPKKEVGAYTLRPKLHKFLSEYLQEPESVQIHPVNWRGRVARISKLHKEIEDVIAKQISNRTEHQFLSGSTAASRQLDLFIQSKLENYATHRNDPSKGSQSELSPYLHFGQISALQVALRLQEEARNLGSDLHFLHSPKMPKPEEAQSTRMDGINSLIEEMIVRKELADNYCFYESEYDSINAAPTWAKLSLEKHMSDVRLTQYSFEQLEAGRTHDNAWNAAQKQLTKTGKMHGYMRMYWAKKVLEWSASPEQAITVLTRLNDFYSIDGGDPNGYAGIAWSVCGVHDRPWNERPVYGVVRSMVYDGLKRKFDITAYEKEWL